MGLRDAGGTNDSCTLSQHQPRRPGRGEATCGFKAAANMGTSPTYLAKPLLVPTDPPKRPRAAPRGPGHTQQNHPGRRRVAPGSIGGRLKVTPGHLGRKLTVKHGIALLGQIRRHQRQKPKDEAQGVDLTNACLSRAGVLGAGLHASGPLVSAGPMSTSPPLQGGRLHPHGLPVRPPHLAARAACATALASDCVSHGTGPTGNIPKDSASPCHSGVPSA